MTHGFKKHIALGTVFSLTLLVGSFQAAPDFKGALSAVKHSPVLNNPVAHVAVAAVAVNLFENVATKALTGKWATQQRCIDFRLGRTVNDRVEFGPRFGCFDLGCSVPAQVSKGVDAENKPLMIPTTLLEKVKGVKLDESFDYVKPFVALYAVRAAYNRLSK